MDIKLRLREYIEEMAYPSQFNPWEFKNIKSFKGKVDYAKQRLLGKLGSGSSRAVFKIDDEKVLKVATNKKGLAQNEAESEPYKQNYDINARVFEYDGDDYMWVEMELAKKITPKRFKELTGCDLNTLSTYLSNILGRSKYGPKLDQTTKEMYDENEWVQNLLSFASDYGYPVPGDFGRISSYGEVLRDGKPTVVLIDFGASEDVINTHYSR